MVPSSARLHRFAATRSELSFQNEKERSLNSWTARFLVGFQPRVLGKLIRFSGNYEKREVCCSFLRFLIFSEETRRMLSNLKQCYSLSFAPVIIRHNHRNGASLSRDRCVCLVSISIRYLTSQLARLASRANSLCPVTSLS